MPNPPDYTPSFSFADWSANNPTLPQPGTALDAEFAAIRATISQTPGSLRDRQINHLLRSDDKLANKIVHRESLDDEVLAILEGSESSAQASADSAANSATLADQSAQAAAQYGGLNTNSATSLTIGTGTQVLTVAADRPFQQGQFVLVSVTGTPSSYMHGQVTAYTFPTLTLDIQKTGGGGTHAAWDVTQSAPAGEDGTAAGALQQAANLSDLENVVTARTNLGLGALAVQNTATIAQVDGLQTELDGKAALSHTHPISDVTGLQAALDGKAPTVHSHAISDVTGLQSELDGKVEEAPTDGGLYSRRNGGWEVAGGWTPIAAQTANNVSSIAFEGYDWSSYAAIMFVGVGLTVGSDGTQIRVRIGNGSYHTAANYSASGHDHRSSLGTTVPAGMVVSSESSWSLFGTRSARVPGLTNNKSGFTFTLDDPTLQTTKTAHSRAIVAWLSSEPTYQVEAFHGMKTVLSGIDRVDFFASLGVYSATIYLYGLTRAN